ncbi:hypothetical protein EMIHUDRAFT_223514 [Emiliania huxleyi CCMP1516]|uniref:U1 small nuclear ribonucleoprotein of 70kDa N-terminal domain-containing protein n=2 Tax=Emiliania huxleyi TaxID=2903 RepID=A0A0D3KUA2_EMIH1|nr:hypothetical protein EMIHUDRAFT_223514 [Emiliania huxleyi CCMP1516]EOD39337.1 hypothetical protein EMIHUDRAFT_223514 [Emiliania huxleyi CCMP1516]|eukprot:XP_005791766.1 hypothetical protein EMIHUDRAFT_223514 [Emiliania huxleyi CCMP1516]
MSSAVAQALPPSILALFAPRPPPPFKPAPEKRKMPRYGTVAHLVSEFEEPSATPAPKPAAVVESKEARRARKAEKRKAKGEADLEAKVEAYDPNEDSKIKGDPYKTLFAKLKKEFEQYLVPSVLFLSVSFLSRVSLASGMAMPRVAAATIMLLTLNGLRAQVQEQMPVGGEFRGWSHAVANTL